VFSKLAVLILTIGAVAATLLAARQQRLQAVHETAEAMRRISEHDRTLWRLRSEIAERVTPGKVRRLATDRFGPMAYLGGPRSSPLHGEGAQEGDIRSASLLTHRAARADEVTETSDWGDQGEPEDPAAANASAETEGHERE
jgi:hypothetical protein